jgi:hypothetical protein
MRGEMAERVTWYVIIMMYAGLVVYCTAVVGTAKKWWRDRILRLFVLITVGHLIVTAPLAILGTVFINRNAHWFWYFEFPAAILVPKILAGPKWNSVGMQVLVPLEIPMNIVVVDTYIYGCVLLIVFGAWTLVRKR